MTREAYDKAKCLLACIESAQKNIESFERICEAGKNEIAICTKEKLNGEHRNVSAIYLSGDTLDAVKNAYIGCWQIWCAEKQAELDSL